MYCSCSQKSHNLHVIYISMNLKLCISYNIYGQNMVKLNHLTFGCSICPFNVLSLIGVKYLVTLMLTDSVNSR